MTDDRFDETIEKLGDTYNRPPETPRDEMWTAIRAALDVRPDEAVISLDRARTRRTGRWTRSGATRWMTWSAAAAALLVLGIGIGRFSAGPDLLVQDDAAAAVSSEPDTEGGSADPSARNSGSKAFRFAAVEHLQRSESLLTMVRSDARSGRFDEAVGGWASELLTETRLLIDSPAAEDPTLRTLLEDLELILVQLARLEASRAEPGPRGQQELDLITRGMDRQDMLLRIQAMAPAGLVGA